LHAATRPVKVACPAPFVLGDEVRQRDTLRSIDDPMHGGPTDGRKDKPPPVPPDRPRKPPVETPPGQPGIPPGEPDPRPKGDPPPSEPTRLV
jgi:hypothetical protein